MGFNVDGLQQTSSPVRLVTGAVGTAGGAPVAADGTTAAAALNATSNSIKAPLSQKGSLVGDGGSPQARSGATAALLNYPTNGATTW
jgi:hypothetical protein